MPVVNYKIAATAARWLGASRHCTRDTKLMLAFFTLSPEGCQRVAGGRNEVETPGGRIEI
jgi:hypothetical protein